MGEVRRWICAASLLLALGYASAGGANVGCIFSKGLCQQEAEWCYDDGAFGRCLATYADATAEDLFRHQLQKEELSALEREMEKLLTQGYRWSHDHTQCIIQAMLYAFQTGTEFQRVICDPLKDQDLDGALRAIEGDAEMDMDPRNMAYIRYTPSAENPHADFADEVYFPPERHPSVEMVEGVIEPEYAVVRRSLPGALHFNAEYNTPDLFRSGYELRDQAVFLPESVEPGEITEEVIPPPFVENIDRNFFREYNTPDNFREGYESRDQLRTSENLNEDEKREFLYALASDMIGELPDKKDRDAGKGYTEGGLVLIPGKSKGNKDAYAEFLDDLGWGFKRRERLDVKKPGPQFNTNNFAFQGDNVQVTPPHKKEVEKVTLDDPDDSEQYDTVDTSYAYVEFENSIRTWKEGSHIIDTVARLLQIPRKIFSHERVDRNDVTFKVEEPNSLGLNATEVARRIEVIKDDLKNEIGLVVTSSGIGDQAKVPVQVRLLGGVDSDMYIVLIVVCGVLTALALFAGVFLTRRHSNNKLHNLTASDTEPSKHYQDLCRARMSSKSQQDSGNGTSGGSGSVAPPQRITSLSRESDNSPSSRSSTSSWSEEPALSNMDISTGHMVLAYMEDHLRNKDRLETEWSALCAYEAEPCATTIAQRPENAKKNRYQNALPYDHARVVLNELSNITGSDYINASTITDHDPRNPAYIVTQGPLPHTAPDLWQMIWEQGCVVIVMLTRLVENDINMCHRYWPEEGSELYHIYEVHLVSEHIWCDDYLVRSFYLKNLKTGETRTVTQFHFLSWPDGGVPTSTKALLEFRRKVNKSFRGRSCPIVVHCSDGVGRSGTYCLLDMVLNRMAKGAKEIDIAATLEHIRDQRAGSVVTKQQFQLVLSAVAEEVQAILRILPQQQQ